MVLTRGAGSKSARRGVIISKRGREMENPEMGEHRLLLVLLQLLEYDGDLGSQIRLTLAVLLLQSLNMLLLSLIVLVHSLLPPVSFLLLLLFRLSSILLDLVEDQLRSLEVVRPRLLPFSVVVHRLGVCRRCFGSRASALISFSHA
ncbi:hypothetical protein PENTCL1PPCAC_11101, partial [Pristionchus entomophagus]